MPLRSKMEWWWRPLHLHTTVINLHCHAPKRISECILSFWMYFIRQWSIWTASKTIAYFSHSLYLSQWHQAILSFLSDWKMLEFLVVGKKKNTSIKINPSVIHCSFTQCKSDVFLCAVVFPCCTFFLLLPHCLHSELCLIPYQIHTGLDYVCVWEREPLRVSIRAWQNLELEACFHLPHVSRNIFNISGICKQWHIICIEYKHVLNELMWNESCKIYLGWPLVDQITWDGCGKQGHGVLNAVFPLQECCQECVCSSPVLQKRGSKINTSTNEII